MEQLYICRTCLKTNLPRTSCIKIFNKTEANQMSLKDMLETFMPEMDLDIFDGEMVLCLQCSELLKNAYIFKNTCLKTEEKIYDYLHHYNIKLGKKICLSSVLSHTISDLNFSSMTNGEDPPESKVVNLPHILLDNSMQGNSDSNPSSSDLFSRDINDFEEMQSENEEKAEVAAPQRTRKCRRATASKKKKDREYYNSLKRSYTCDLCEYKAYRVDLLTTHKLKHDKNMVRVKEYKCELCMYSTPRKRALDRHLFTHKRQSQHLCEVCNKPFAEKYQLKLHEMTHTGQELPHKCQECGKGYLTKSYLKQHMETRHLAKDKQVCLECNEEKCEHLFTRYYKCKMCDSSFSDKRGLDAHKFTHTGGELPFKCLHCSFSTAWKGNLKKHLHNKH